MPIKMRIGLALAMLAAMAVPAAYAGAITQLANASTLTTDYLDWASLGADLDPLTPPVNTLTNGGRSTTISGPSSLTIFSGSTFNADFLVSDVLIAAYDIGNFQDLPGAIRITFAAPIRGAGAQIQVNQFGAFVGTLRAFGAGNTLWGSVTVNGSVNGNGDGSAPFIGLTSDTTDILALEFVGNKDTVVINRLNLLIPGQGGGSDIPEPSTCALAAAGIAVLAWRRR